MDTLGKRFGVNFLVYAHWFVSTGIYQMRDHSVYVDQAIYATYIVAKYLVNATVKTSKINYNTTFPSDMIFNKAYASTSDDQV